MEVDEVMHVTLISATVNGGKIPKISVHKLTINLDIDIDKEKVDLEKSK
jgi:hypothetical protein